MLLLGLSGGEGQREFEALFGVPEGREREKREDGPGRHCALLLDRIGLGEIEQVLRLTLFHPAYYKIIIAQHLLSSFLPFPSFPLSHPNQTPLYIAIVYNEPLREAQAIRVGQRAHLLQPDPHNYFLPQAR